MACVFHYYASHEPLLHHAVEKSMLQCLKYLVVIRNVDVNKLCSGDINAIAIAIDNKDIEVVKMLLPYVNLRKRFMVWDEDRKEYFTTKPIQYARYVGNDEVCAALLEKADSVGVDESDEDEVLDTSRDIRLLRFCSPDGDLIALHSVLVKDFVAMRLLLDYDKAGVNEQCDCGDTVLGAAIRSENVNAVKIVLDKGGRTDINVPFPLMPPEQASPLALAAEIGNCDIIKAMVPYCNDFNVSDVLGRTPLMIAAASKNFDCMKLLIDAGCDVTITDNGRANVLCHLLDQEVREMDRQVVISWIYQLKVRGCSLNSCDDAGRHPLWFALNHDNEVIFRALLRAGADANYVCRFGDSTLYSATSISRANAVNYVEILLENGAVPDMSSDSPLPATVLNRHCGYRMFEMLLDREADINGVHPQFGTTLVASATYGKPEFTRAALQRHAQINICDYAVVRQSPVYMNAEALLLVFASGEEYPYFNYEGDDRPQVVRNAEEDVSLANICRKSVRKYLVERNNNRNLFDLVAHTGLPNCLQRYLLFDISFT